MFLLTLATLWAGCLALPAKRNQDALGWETVRASPHQRRLPDTAVGAVGTGLWQLRTRNFRHRLCEARAPLAALHPAAPPTGHHCPVQQVYEQWLAQPKRSRNPRLRHSPRHSPHRSGPRVFRPAQRRANPPQPPRPPPHRPIPRGTMARRILRPRLRGNQRDGRTSHRPSNIQTPHPHHTRLPPNHRI